MSMPRLQTRAENKKTRPGRDAGLEPKKRRNASQMQQARAQEARKHAKAKLDATQKLKRLADIEDEQQEDDIAYAATADHPVDDEIDYSVDDAVEAPAQKLGKPNKPSGELGDNNGSEDDSDQYEPGSNESEQEEEEEDPSEPEDEPVGKKRKKQATVARRFLIISCRSTGRNASKKPKVAGKKSGLISAPAKSKSSKAPATEDESMVAPGGPAFDDDAEEDVERPKKGKKKKGIPTAPVIAIQVIPTTTTRKAARGGLAKWNLRHLPAGTAAEFTNEVVPLARELAGTLPPWANLTLKQCQGLVDKVYGEGKHIVTADGPWAGLIAYRLSDWRSNIGTHAGKGLEVLVDSWYDSDDEDGDGAEPTMSPATEVDPSAVHADANTSTAENPAPKPLKFRLDSPEGIAEFVAWSLEPGHESGTMPFQWESWGGGVEKKGFLQSNVILYTFSYHLSTLASIPGGYGRLEAEPIGALLMSMQAVGRELEFWRTGECVRPPSTPANYFSVDNFGDTVTTVNGKQKHVQKWDAERWAALKEAAEQWVELPSRRRAGTSSRSASEAGDDSAILSDDEVEVFSD
ncbi:hypothetical protein B0H16DRAFT_1696718 [Mycena metata]|uniref:Uncharacterized protein n=1 Tax=Mycena metata TaxID=1033252 RepID=A0AAD7I0V1_9AGAR|nr:hypothetical protein B0H16DRAFT_1696718 [Mycena metata]